MPVKFVPARRKFLNQLSRAGLASLVLPSVLDSTSVQARTETGTVPFTILFQGDSITDGNRGRSDDPNHIMGHGYAFSIASRLGADYPQRNLKFINKGISGNTVTDLMNRWQADVLDLKPNVVSILVGVNDAYFRIKDNIITPDEFEKKYRMLLDQTRLQIPEVLFVLGAPFILPVGMVKEKWNAWQSEIEPRQQVVKKLAKEFNAVWVDYQDTFTKASEKASPDYWIWDGIHPTVAGHELMARKWIAEVEPRLPVITKKYRAPR